MAAEKRYPVPPETAENALLSREAYYRMYRRSLEEPEAFWAEQAEEFLTWFRKWDRVSNNDLSKGQIRWFEGGKLNVSYNCLDRHLDTHGERNAIIWEGDSPGVTRHITYRELHADVCRLANVLKQRGVSKGDRVSIYMPMIPEAVVAMLACTRIGAVHSIVFGGFSPHALRDRIEDADCRTVITADQGLRSGKPVPLKENVDKAIDGLDSVHSVITVRHTGNPVPWNNDRDIEYAESLAEASTDCEPEEMDAEDPLFILYTSGSTGKPKGVLHTTGGYLLQASMTFKYVFDYKDGEIYWCTADVGWITGHSYIVYGPLSNAATSLMFEGVPTYPDAGRLWQIVDDHQVNIFYTAPTAIRSLMGLGEEPVKKHSRQSLRVLGTVGEPINPEAWEWYYRVVGDERCRIVDTWWQTETGAIMISALPGAIDLKPGSATLPFFGVEPQLVDNEGNVLEGATDGNLCLTRAWPGMMRTIYGDHERFMNTYLTTYPGKYFTGDGARRDEEGYYWITGRVDDVLNVSGHRMGTAEIESALVLHDAVAEAAVVGYPHDLKGQGIYCYVTLIQGVEPNDELEKELAGMVRSEIGPIAKPDVIQWAPGLPKTRSGKIMRRILRKVATNELDSLGDTSTLADPGVVDDLISNRANQ
ncbi:acetate--CoA ligase [Spiribacter vilamensis]|uniref:Acetyl-coenzyme A synthetase n=1 Tax=Spiribacter vilamensis TaxID=531306 RepID=A0A4Q8D0N8_9GAMM|nr:acetate--CoA ligase [Spiribacter vilamensis]RZU98844.1 acetyl-coenzyme A synthetase [Spiribacter vilamensis]TVO62138.1 acetate--CoA ligase [Spiribacter vilamensis]